MDYQNQNQTRPGHDRPFSYEIVRHIATLSQYGDSTKEVNLISYNGSKPKLDIRGWKVINGEKRLMKGLTLNEAEVDALRLALLQYSNPQQGS